MCITCIVSFGLCYPPGEDGFPNHYEWVIENNLNFIVMGTLGATALVGMGMSVGEKSWGGGDGARGRVGAGGGWCWIL